MTLTNAQIEHAKGPIASDAGRNKAQRGFGTGNAGQPNRITGPYSAMVDGSPTGLSGCSNDSCPKRDWCLRAAGELKSQHYHPLREDGSCAYLIPRQP